MINSEVVLSFQNRIKLAQKLLEDAGIDSSNAEARMLFEYCMGLKFYDLLNLDKFDFIAQRSNEYEALIRRRTRRVPLQYITGVTEFMGLKLKVCRGVFIPRPETEILVQTTIDIVKSLEGDVAICDLCAGSANIAISLTKHLNNCKILAIDISPFAILMAKYNARMNKCGERIDFICADLFSGIRANKFDIIVSNPPYIKSSDINSLMPEIGFEPRIALDAGSDGLKFYRKIILRSGRFLTPGGHLIIEIGDNQRRQVLDLINKSGKFKFLYSVKDFNNIDRVVVARLK